MTKREFVDCNICRIDNTRDIWSNREHRIVQCRRCGLVYANPRQCKDDLNKIYSRDYFLNYYIENRESRLEYFHRLFQDMPLEKREGRILDVGCGVGFFLKVARDCGWETYGVEPARYAAEFGQKEYGLSIYCGLLGEVHYKDNFFDVVTIWDVLCSVQDPMSILREVFLVLKDGGTVIIKVPNRPSIIFLIARILSLFMNAKGLLHLPAQIYQFTPKTLSNMMERINLKIFQVTYINEVKKKRYAQNRFKNILLMLFNLVIYKLMGLKESFIVYAKKTS